MLLWHRQPDSLSHCCGCANSAHFNRVRGLHALRWGGGGGCCCRRSGGASGGSGAGHGGAGARRYRLAGCNRGGPRFALYPCQNSPGAWCSNSAYFERQGRRPVQRPLVRSGASVSPGRIIAAAPRPTRQLPGAGLGLALTQQGLSQSATAVRSNVVGSGMGETLTSSSSVPPPTVRWPEKAKTVLVDVAVASKVYRT